MDTVGAVLGPLAAIGLMVVFVGDMRSVLWIGVVAAVFSVIVLVVFVSEPNVKGSNSARNPVSFKNLGSLGKYYWSIVALGAVLTLARFSEAFLILRAQDLGIALALVPVVLIVMNVVYTFIAYPAGVAADRGFKKVLLVWGIAALLAAAVVIR